MAAGRLREAEFFAQSIAVGHVQAQDLLELLEQAGSVGRRLDLPVALKPGQDRALARDMMLPADHMTLSRRKALLERGSIDVIAHALTPDASGRESSCR
jgi:hypothetical protein